MRVTIPEIDVDQLSESVRAGAAIIDVREPSEYVVGHVPGAVLIPMGELPSRLTELDRYAAVMSCVRRATAAAP
jgi:rhodanese-related sulfurtransferase